ncbi:MAG: hypothetical protein R8F63_15680 [Acidimicrobiales bacterium]|nr:hypothetical protein [Acidimicrobiales bacterium]
MNAIDKMMGTTKTTTFKKPAISGRLAQARVVVSDDIRSGSLSTAKRESSGRHRPEGISGHERVGPPAKSAVDATLS